MKKISTLLIFLLLLCSCSTAFKNPIVYDAKDKSPMIRIVQQGSIPADKIYRPIFYIVTNQDIKSKEFIIPAEVIAAVIQQVISASADASRNYYDTLKVNYRYRNDVFIYNYPNLSQEEIETIIENFTQPQLDVQRSPIIK